MNYSIIPSVILIEWLTLSESIVYSTLKSVEAFPFTTRWERLVYLLDKVIHVMTRVTVNVSLKKLESLDLINHDLQVTALPSKEKDKTVAYSTSWRPKNADR